MKIVPGFFALFAGALLTSSAGAQTTAHSPAPPSDAAQLQMLIKKIDEQNAKIDTLSQQILKLEQQISNTRPGVMIGEATPTATTPATSESAAHSMDGRTHTVARGETLTSIAKMHGVTVSDLQKWNHIDDGRKLQMGQTILIAAPPSPSPAPSSGE